jgi:uncharacterized protein (TIGR03118 family)
VEGLEERALMSAAPELSGHHLARIAHHDVRHFARLKPLSAYQQTNLASNLASGAPGGTAQVQDTTLVNPWGMSFSNKGPFWISDAGTNASSIYQVDQSGVLTNFGSVAVAGGPTGQVFNGSSTDFLIPGPSGPVPALFIFDTLGGTISGWSFAGNNPGAAVTMVNKGSTELFTGLALGSSNGQNYLYAADPTMSPGIDVFNSSWTQVSLAGNFTDPKLKAGYAPYNIQNIGGELFVTYRTSGAGGAVAEFNTDGTFVRQIAINGNKGNLQAPWGVAIAPSNFGKFSNDLLVGNFGNGKINAYHTTGRFKFAGTLVNPRGKPIVLPGLWALDFGNGQKAGSSNILYFAAGINGQSGGLFGALTPTTRHR